MERCEHGEKIDTFCASECCVWREAAGCSSICMKKYHNHMGPSTLVQERDLDALLKKYKVEAWIKPKVKTLQESLHNYFNCLKIELNNYVDELDKKLRTELCYPYLNKHHLVGVYKKLRKRDYRKVQQREFRHFYEQTLRLSSDTLSREERELYEEELSKDRGVILELFRAVNILEDNLRAVPVAPLHFQMDKTYEQKIRATLDSISFSKRNSEEELEEEVKEKFEDLSVTQSRKLVTQTSKDSLRSSNAPSHWASSNKVGRKKSMEAEDAVVESSSLNKGLQKKSSIKSKAELDKMKNEIVNLMSNSKKEESLTFDFIVTAPTPGEGSHSVVSSGANFDSRPKEANRNFLTVDAKPSHVSSSIQSLALSDKFGGKTPLKQGNEITDVKHDRLPSQKSNMGIEEKEKKRKFAVDLKLVVMPIQGEKTLEPSEMSPLLQKKKKFFESNAPEPKEGRGFNLELKPVKEESPTKEAPPVSPTKPRTSQTEERSLELLTEAIQLKGEDAVPLLKEALLKAPNNLSAAEYLSFLLLESGNPKECLRVCNNIHEQLQDEMIYTPDLFHVNNNRAVALLSLGRYSEAIQGLEKSLLVEEHALTYKNLGDAYYSIGIHEKAVYNFEKSISLKPMGETYFNLAVCLFVQQNYHNSSIMAGLAVGLCPDIPEYETLVKEIKNNI